MAIEVFTRRAFLGMAIVGSTFAAVPPGFCQRHPDHPKCQPSPSPSPTPTPGSGTYPGYVNAYMGG